MSAERRASTATVATVATVVLLLLYPVSFGPACWLTVRMVGLDGQQWISGAYKPLFYAYRKLPNRIQEAVEAYANLGCGDDVVVVSPHGVMILETEAAP